MKKTKKGRPGRPTHEVTEAKLSFAKKLSGHHVDEIQHAVRMKFGTRLGPRSLAQLAAFKRQKKRAQPKREASA